MGSQGSIASSGGQPRLRSAESLLDAHAILGEALWPRLINFQNKSGEIDVENILSPLSIKAQTWTTTYVFHIVVRTYP